MQCYLELPGEKRSRFSDREKVLLFVAFDEFRKCFCDIVLYYSDTLSLMMSHFQFSHIFPF